MTIEKLFEVKTKGLTKLGSDNAIDVISDFPEEFVRLLINSLENAGFSFHKDSKKHTLRKLRDTISGTSLSRRNPLLDTSNKYGIDLDTDNLKDSLDITMSVVGNTLSVEKLSMNLTASPGFSIKLKGMSANQVINEIVDRALKVKKIADKKITSREEWEKDRESLKKTDKTEIENRLERIANKLGGLFFSEVEENRLKIVTRPDDKIVGIPYDLISKLKTDDFRNLRSIEMSYQFDIMKKIWNEVYKAIDRSEYRIITSGLTDYLWFEIEIVNPERENMKYNKSYQEVHEEMKQYVENLLDKGKENAPKKTVSDLRRLAVIQIVEKDEI